MGAHGSVRGYAERTGLGSPDSGPPGLRPRVIRAMLVGVHPQTADHARRADVLHRVLEDRFWRARQGLFAVAEGRPLSPLRPWHHWWQSQALAALLDRVQRTGDELTTARAYALVEGMRGRGRGRLTNEFYDDMGWLALALLRLPGRESDVATVLGEIRRGEMPEGGIAWSSRHPELRNVPATGPAAITALCVAARTGDAQLRAWGLSLVQWMNDTVVGPDGHVADGFRLHDDRTTSIDPDRYSYNYGLVIGTELAAHAITGEDDRIDHALVVAAAALRQLTDPITGVWVSEGRHDRALFRGILARFLAELAVVSHDTTVASAVRSQADAVWQSCGGGPVSHEWRGPAERPVELSEHVGGLLVVEAAARLPG